MFTSSDTHRTYTNLNSLLESRQVCFIIVLLIFDIVIKCFFFKNLDEFRSGGGFNGNNMMYYMGQYGPILNQPITSMIVNERPHNCNTAGKPLKLKIIHVLIYTIFN